MAVQEVRLCDVFGTTKEVKNYDISITTKNEKADTVVIESRVCDLSNRALLRLTKFIDRGISKCGKDSM